MKKVLMLSVVVFALYANAATDSDVTVYTQTFDDVQWRFSVDTDNKTALLGGAYKLTNIGRDSANNDASHRTFVDKDSYSGKPCSIPQTFTVDEEEYKVAALNNRAFAYGAFTDLQIPMNNDFTLGQYCIFLCSSMTNLFFKGPASVTKNATQSYCTLNCASSISHSFYSSFNGDGGHMLLVGPNVKGSNLNKFKANPAMNNIKVFLPRRSDNTTWAGVTTTSMNANNSEVIFYGPDYNFDLKMGADSMTAYPVNAQGLVDVLQIAATEYNAFGMKTYINVTNAIEIAEGLITGKTLEYATFNSLMLKVSSQAQLDSVLNAIPASVPFAIDASDATRELTLPQGREIYVRVSAEGKNGKYTPKVNGTIISLH